MRNEGLYYELHGHLGTDFHSDAGDPRHTGNERTILGLNVQTQAEHAAHATREIRLLQIKEELSRMMKMPQQKATMRWQLGEKR